MDISRFCSIEGGEQNTKHQRITEYVKAECDAYPGMGFTPRMEWIVERTMAGLRAFLADVRCTDEERRAIEEFLQLAAEELPGSI